MAKRIFSESQREHNRKRAKRARVVSNWLTEALGDYTVETATEYVKQNNEYFVQFLNKHGYENDDRIIGQAFGIKKDNDLKRQQYKEQKTMQSESYIKKVEQTKIRDAQRSKGMTRVRKLLQEETPIPAELQPLLKRVIYVKAAGKKTKEDEPRTESEIRFAALKIATQNEEPDKADDIYAKLLPFAAASPNDWNNEKRKYKKSYRESSKRQDQRPRRKALKKLARALRPPNTSKQPRPDFTLEHKTKLAEYGRKYRLEQAEKIKITREKFYPTYMKRTNATFDIPTSLELECDLEAFLKEFFQLPCAYCSSEEEKIGIDRINAQDYYHIDNIVPCCSNCNFAKSVLSPTEFVEHAQKITVYQDNNLELCAYCGSDTNLGTDRIDSNLNYVEGNCLACCSTCNYMKGARSLNDFLDHMDHIKNGISSSQKRVQELYDELKSKYSTQAKLIKNRDSVMFCIGRQDTDVHVAILGPQLIYHSAVSKCLSDFKNGEEIPKLFKHDRKQMTFMEALARNKAPCKMCRSQLTREEYDIWTNKKQQPLTVERVMKVQARFGQSFLSGDRCATEQFFIADQEPFYHVKQNCLSLLQQHKAQRLNFSQITMKYPCFRCIRLVYANENKVTEEVKKDFRRLSRTWLQKRKRQQSG